MAPLACGGHTYRTACQHHPLHTLRGAWGGGPGWGRVHSQLGVRLHRRSTVWGERRSGSHVTSRAAATDGAPCLWGAHLPHRLPTPSIGHPVRCLGRWPRTRCHPILTEIWRTFPPLHNLHLVRWLRLMDVLTRKSLLFVFETHITWWVIFPISQADTMGICQYMRDTNSS